MQTKGSSLTSPASFIKMPPKNHKKQKEVIKKEKLQAVVLTDSFETKFMPLTAVQPRCLLPLSNVPLIEYTLEFLANAGVDEVFLMCAGPHSEQIQEYIEKSKWSLPWSPFKIKCIITLEARSVGDVMRDLDNRSVITEDFLLISGDVISNVNIEKALKHHRTIRESDKDHIVTMVMTEASATHRSRSFDDDPAVFILRDNDNKCLYYEDVPSINGAKSDISIDPELLEDVDDFVIRNDLIDCHIDICSPIIPAIYQENFDFQHIRKDFLKGILTFDLLKRSIYVYISQDYGARVSNYKTYKSISKDLVERFIYPIVPESNFLENQSYQYESNHVYKDAKILLAQSCKIGSNTVIGHDSFIDDLTTINDSIVGNNVKIGKNVEIENSIILDNVTIGNNTKIYNSIVGFNVDIKSSVNVLSGSVIGSKCVIDDYITIDEGVRVIDHKISVNNDFSSEEDEESDSQDEIRDKSVVGENGVGFLYEEESDYDSDDSSSEYSKQSSSALYKLSTLALSDVSISSVETNKDASKHKKHSHKKTDSLSISSSLSTKKHRRYSNMSQLSADDNPERRREKEEEEFYVEASATVERAIENNHDIDTAVLELNTLRMSMNVTYGHVRRATLRTLVSKIKSYVETNTLKLNEATVKIFGQWGILFKRQVFDSNDEIDLLNVLNELVKEFKDDKVINGMQLHFYILRQLYELELVDEENITSWYEQNKDTVDNKYVSQFVEWLNSAEEESSDEDSDEE